MNQEEFKTLLRKASCKITPARLAVLEALQRAQKPMNAAQISQAIGSSHDQVTVYRTLQTLETAGIIKQITFHDRAAYYELAAMDEHHHAVCTNCHAVEDITDCCLSSMEKTALKQSNFASITRHSLEFFGLCKRCAKS